MKRVVNGDWRKTSAMEKPFKRIKNSFTVERDMLWMKGKHVLPQMIRRDAITQCHECHLGIQRTLNLLKRNFWWPSMKHDVSDYNNMPGNKSQKQQQSTKLARVCGMGTDPH